MKQAFDTLIGKNRGKYKFFFQNKTKKRQTLGWPACSFWEILRFFSTQAIMVACEKAFFKDDCNSGMGHKKRVCMMKRVIFFGLFCLLFSVSGETAQDRKKTKAKPPAQQAGSSKQAKKSSKQAGSSKQAKKSSERDKPVSRAKSSGRAKPAPRVSPSSPDPAIKGLTQGLELLNRPSRRVPPSQQAKPSGQVLPSGQVPPSGQVLPASRHRSTGPQAGRQGALSDLSPRSLVVLARAYEQKGDYENQVLTLRQLLNRHKKKGLYLLELARGLKNLYFKTGLFKHREEAIKIINEVHALNNKKHREQAHLQMLELLKFKEDSEENKYAILNLLQVLIREFGVKKIYVQDICKYLYINEFYRQSLASCKKAIKYYPQSATNHVYYALSLKDPKKTGEYLKQTATKFPKSAFAQIQAGQFLIQQKDYAQALPYFKRAGAEEPDSAPAQVGLAQALFHTGQEKKSYKFFLKACMLNKPKMLWAFKQAKSILNQKSLFALASFFDRGITKCFLQAGRSRGQNKKTK